ncbi:hypothetical protein V8E36_004266 [Tilletia maclaganii]
MIIQALRARAAADPMYGAVQRWPRYLALLEMVRALQRAGRRRSRARAKEVRAPSRRSTLSDRFGSSGRGLLRTIHGKVTSNTVPSWEDIHRPNARSKVTRACDLHRLKENCQLHDPHLPASATSSAELFSLTQTLTSPRQPAYSIKVATYSFNDGQPRVHIKETLKPVLNATDDILVRVDFAAQNPPDIFAFRHPSSEADGMGLGSDFAGEVVEILTSAGSLAQLPNGIQIGSKVCGMVTGSVVGQGTGAFSEYIATSSRQVIRIPEEIPAKSAVTFGMSFWTSFHALYMRMKLEPPPRTTTSSDPTSSPGGREAVLIWGGASACGLFAVQIAKASRCVVIATASSSSKNIVRHYGADHVIDYRQGSAKVIENVHQLAPDLRYALDCIGNEDSISTSILALGLHGGYVHHLMPAPPGFANLRPDGSVRYDFALIHTMLGRPIPWAHYLFDPIPTPAEMQPEQRQAEDVWLDYDRGLAYDLISSGRVKPLPVYNSGKAWAGIEEGIENMAKGQVKVGKVVHTLGSV